MRYANELAAMNTCESNPRREAKVWFNRSDLSYRGICEANDVKEA